MSIIEASLSADKLYLSNHIIKALNFHAITCLHTNAGEFRPCPVKVGEYIPPEHFRVEALMADFVNLVNRRWEETDPLVLATYVLWRLNHIHPFINGNGRTARAIAYFVLCVRSGGVLPGSVMLPELLKRDRDEYVAALQQVDDSYNNANFDLTPLHALMQRLVEEQLST
ncbi:Fic family protein [Methylophilus aquaticus]|uniref:Fic family protein n=1 Tax=Methylophilus aquaticus TaxID=1971610 RepID=A0ABT9JRL6_9PROT|nr:Fic family protein [Methylophilus aquaticus]MDP8567185.1 Fic family protein [Methylophilus aquaticus]